jgi:predicted Zn-dependent protease
MKFSRAVLAIAAVVLLAACATVPHSGRSQLLIVSDGEIDALAARSYKTLLERERPCADRRLTARVKKVAQRIIAAAEELDHPGFDWEVSLIEKDEANAFCMPGGKIAVYTGIIPLAKNEAGLAAVLGHEVAHAVARHGAERMSQQLLLTGMIALGNIALSAEASPENRRILAAIGLGAEVGIILPFSRLQEEEADEIGLYYMAGAGYDPAEAPRLWQRMAAAFGGKEPPVWLSTHPSSAQRTANLTALVPEAEKYYQDAPHHYGTGEDL